MTLETNGGNTSGGQQSNGWHPGGKTEETISASEPEGTDNEGEFVIPSEKIHLPVVPLK